MIEFTIEFEDGNGFLLAPFERDRFLPGDVSDLDCGHREDALLPFTQIPPKGEVCRASYNESWSRSIINGRPSQVVT